MATNGKLTNLFFIFISLAMSQHIPIRVDADDVSNEWCGRTTRKDDCMSIVKPDRRANLKTSPNGVATILRDKAVVTALNTSLEIAKLLQTATDKREIATLRICSADYFETINTLTTANFKVIDRQTYPTLVAVINTGDVRARDCELSFKRPPAIRSSITVENQRLVDICGITLEIVNLVVCNRTSSC